MRQRVVSDRMPSTSQLRNLCGIHGLPILPFFVAGFRVRINPRTVKGESLGGRRAFREGRHNEKYTASSERLKQRSRDCVIALSSIVKREQDRRFGACNTVVMFPKLGEALQIRNRKVLGRRFKLSTKLRFQRDRRFVHRDYESVRSAFEPLEIQSQGIRTQQAGRLNEKCTSLASDVHVALI